MPYSIYTQTKLNYSKTAIINCLKDGFDESAMVSLCMEHPFFEDQWRSYSGIPLGDKINSLAEFARMKSMFPELLKLIKVKNERKFLEYKNAMIRTTRVSSEESGAKKEEVTGEGLLHAGKASRLRLDVECLALHVDLLEDIESLLDRLPRFIEQLDKEILESKKDDWGDSNTYLRLISKLIPDGKETISTLNTYMTRIQTNSDKLLNDNLKLIMEHTNLLETVHGHFGECLPTFSEDCNDLIVENSPAIKRRVLRHLLTLRRAVSDERVVDNTKIVQGAFYNGVRSLVADLAQEVGIEKDYSK